MKIQQMVLSSLCAIALSTFSQAQTDAVGPAPEPYVLRSDLNLTYYRFQVEHPKRLIETVKRLFGRTLQIRDGINQETYIARNFFEFDDVFVIYEGEQETAQILKTLHEFEAEALVYEQKRKAEEAEQKQLAKAEEEQARKLKYSRLDQDPIVEHTYHAKNVSKAALLTVRDSFLHYVDVLDANGTKLSFYNCSVTEKPLTFLIRDTQDHIDKILKRLEDIDRPAPQIILTAYLLSPTGYFEHPSKVAVPKELASNLANLTPYDAFDQLAMSSVRAQVGPDRSVAYSFNSVAGTFRLELKDMTFDETKRLLAVRSTTLRKSNGLISRESEASWVVLQSAFSASENEYAVIGLTGDNDEPILLALRFQMIPAPQTTTK